MLDLIMNSETLAKIEARFSNGKERDHLDEILQRYGKMQRDEQQGYVNLGTSIEL